MKLRFRWNEWNQDHIRKHGITEDEAEFVVKHAAPPFPRQVEEQKFLVRGKTAAGRYLQVIFVIDPEEEFDFEELSHADILELTEEQEPRRYVIHARELTRREKSKYRRGR